MTEPFTVARFRDLADAYGGIVARWPEKDRDAAMRMASSTEGAEILARASMLDETLDTWRVSAPGTELYSRVMSTTPDPRPRLATRARLWWSGIGIAAALTGAVVGAAAVAIVAPVEASDSATSFGDITAQES
jgi:hypothetical protein